MNRSSGEVVRSRFAALAKNANICSRGNGMLMEVASSGPKYCTCYLMGFVQNILLATEDPTPQAWGSAVLSAPYAATIE